MGLLIKLTELNEAERLLKIQYDAFIEDEKVYGLSPSQETLEKLIYKIKNTFFYTIFHEGEIIGGINVCKISEFTYRIKRVFLDVNYQNRGFGSEILSLIESEFPDAYKWTLDTPKLNYRNQHFYEKSGYKKIGETKYSEKLVLIDYVKTISN